MEIAPNDRLAAEMHFAKARENRVVRGATLCGACWRKLTPRQGS